MTKIDNSKIPPNAIKTCKMLQDAGHEAYLVGGCVRDLIMGESPKDWDITSSSTPEETMKIFSSIDESKYPKYYPTGIAHGTITVALGPNPDTDHFEVTVYRSEGEYTDGRRPEEIFFEKDLDKDLERRDLTINAIAYDPVNNEIRDPFGGMRDIENKIIKAVGSADKRFSEDGLRTMRAARFAARFNFNMEKSTKEAIRDNIPTLSKVSKERIQDELTKTLKTKDPSRGLKILYETGCLEVLGNLFQNPKLESNIEKLNNCAGLYSRLAVLFFGLPENDVNENLRFLKFSNKEILRISFLVKKLNEISLTGNLIDQDKVRFLASFKNQGEKVDNIEGLTLDFTEAAKALGINVENLFDSQSTVASEKDFKKLLNGNYLIQLGVPPGPVVKEILTLVYQKVLSGEVPLDKVALEEEAKRIWDSKKKTSNLNNRKKIFKMAQEFWKLSPEEKVEWQKKVYDFGDGRRYEAGELPHIREMIDVPAGPEEHHPEKNQAIHNWLVYQKAREISDNPKDWYAAALHDLGKVHTDKSIWPRQYSHEGLGVKPVEELSTSLGVPEDWKEIAKLVAENHLLGHQGPQLTPKRIKKLFEDLKTPENVKSFLNSINADHRGRYGRELEAHPNIDFFEKKYNEHLNPPQIVEKQKLVLTSKELMDLGYKGPELGKVKKELEQLIEANPEMNEREALINHLKTI